MKTQDTINRLKKLIPEAHCTYCHPDGINEHGWVAHIWDKPLSGMHDTCEAACNEAITNWHQTHGKDKNP
jgi:hypothetical protein